MKFRLYMILALSLVVSLASAATSWQPLNAGYFVPRKMPMTVVFPQPDSSTNTWARQRLAYADGATQYRIPIAIQGGAYPFHFELTSAPPGMAIGQNIGDPNYGIVTWTPQTSDISTTPYQVTVKVTDQQLYTTSVSWTVTATTSGFVFVDPNAATNGNGTKSSPYNTTTSIFKAKGSTNPNYGKIVYFRGGVTKLTGPDYYSSDGNAATLTPNLNPAVFLGYPGENATIDFSNAMFYVMNQNDIFVGELNLKNANNTVPNPRFFFFGGTENRMTFFETNFNGIYRGTSGADNPASIAMFRTQSVLRQYLTIMDCTQTNYDAAMLDLYNVQYMVIENNTLNNSNVGPGRGQGIYLKADAQYASIRRNTSLQQTFNSGAIELSLYAMDAPNKYIEVAYNNIASSGTAANGNRYYAIQFENTGGNGQLNTNPNIYLYRNTFVGAVGGRDDFPYSVTEENNIFIDSDTYDPAITNVSGTYRTIINGTSTAGTANLIGTSADGYIDTSGNITGSANITKYLGKVGHQIVNANPLDAPSWTQ